MTMDHGHAVLDLDTPMRTYRSVRLALAGAHQAGNAVVAVRALEQLSEAGLPGIDADAITAGLRSAAWPARLEWLRAPGQPAILLDAAHNPAGAAALGAYLATLGAPVTLVVSVMQDKDVPALLAPLLPHAARVIATQADTPRALGADALAAVVRGQALAGTDVQVCAHPPDAVRVATQDGGTAVIAGSIFLVGPLRQQLLERGYTSPWA